MKKILTLFILFVTAFICAQNTGITYQAVIYGPNGQQVPGANNQQFILANKTICLQFSVIDQQDQIEYQETIVTTTDKFGMVNLLIGVGNQQSGYANGFNDILWNANTKSLKVELDPTQACREFTVISNNPFTYVPFAFHSLNPGNPGEQGEQGPIGLTGPEGPQGDQGLIGLTGPQGPQGEQGPIGLTGPEGPQGEQGSIGLTGPEGPQGNQGPIGLTGPEGPQGEQGLIGLTGPEGPQGEQGPIGLTGPEGPQGEQGPIGLTGPEGPQGEQGPIGLTGPEGPQGEQGPIGLTGPEGTQGAQGPEGQEGLSAYQIWLNLGNTGTEADFIASLTGPQGIPGNSGAYEELELIIDQNFNILPNQSTTFDISNINSQYLHINFNSGHKRRTNTFLAITAYDTNNNIIPLLNDVFLNVSEARNITSTPRIYFINNYKYNSNNFSMGFGISNTNNIFPSGYLKLDVTAASIIDKITILIQADQNWGGGTVENINPGLKIMKKIN